MEFNRSLQVLSDTFAVEDVVAFGLYGVFSSIVAKSADGRFAVIGYELGEVVLASDDEIWVARHLSHAGQAVERIRQAKPVTDLSTHRLKILE